MPSFERFEGNPLHKESCSSFYNWLHRSDKYLPDLIISHDPIAKLPDIHLFILLLNHES
jgi:hypothetical protein